MTLIEKIAEAGVVGCGGAGFPTDLKLNCAPEFLIINGAECEPLLRTDRYVMRHKAYELVLALNALKNHLNCSQTVFALKEEYFEETRALQEAIDKAGAQIKIHLLQSFYPAGDEQTLVYEVTGRIVPPGGIPIAVGAVVQNVSTLLAIHDAMAGKVFTHRYLTVSGAVEKPSIMYVPVGTSAMECLEQCGGVSVKDWVLVCGGPMMGRYISPEEAQTQVVTKTTSGFLVLPAQGRALQETLQSTKHMLNRARSACIQCSACTQLCPRNLLGHPLEPHRIMRRLSMDGLTETSLLDSVVRNALICCECGICEQYACPMGLQPRRINAIIKRSLQGVRPNVEPTDLAVDPMREERKAPTHRVGARAGVYRYMDIEIDRLITYTPQQVSIPCKMHIGPAANPIVEPGQFVEAGSCIARRAENKGANIHTGLGGRVISVGDQIVISGR